MKYLFSLTFAVIAVCFYLLGMSDMNLSLKWVLFIFLVIAALLTFYFGRNRFSAIRKKPGYIAVFSIGMSLGFAAYYFYKMYAG